MCALYYHVALRHSGLVSSPSRTWELPTLAARTRTRYHGGGRIGRRCGDGAGLSSSPIMLLKLRNGDPFRTFGLLRTSPQSTLTLPKHFLLVSPSVVSASGRASFTELQASDRRSRMYRLLRKDGCLFSPPYLLPVRIAVYLNKLLCQTWVANLVPSWPPTAFGNHPLISGIGPCLLYGAASVRPSESNVSAFT